MYINISLYIALIYLQEIYDSLLCIGYQNINKMDGNGELYKISIDFFLCVPASEEKIQVCNRFFASLQ